jgi:hypothetical protein
MGRNMPIRGLVVLVIGMGVLIVAGLAVIAVTIVHRMVGRDIHAASAALQAVLDQPAGTQIVGASASGDRLAITLHGGGPDRVTILDLNSGRALGEVRLAPR